MYNRLVGLLLFLAAFAMSESCSDGNPWPYTKASLRVGESLAPGQSLMSRNARLILETDGNLRFIRRRDNATVWQTNTANGICNASTMKLVMTSTQLQIVDAATTCWFTAFDAPSEILVVRDHCSLDAFQVAPYTNRTWTSGPAKCIQAHIVPHSHDDVGWLLTPERYYDGCHTTGGGVRGILDTVMKALVDNTNRTYNQVESYFFNRWWKEQSDATKASVRKLIADGRLVFLNGGWSMHDEACVHQESAISNMEVGARFLMDEFGYQLNIGWHIDPFGHASTTPRIMAEMGFDAFFFWRTDYEQRQHNMETKQFEVVWKNSPSLGNKTNMFTSIMYNNYCYGCADDTCPSKFTSYWCEYPPHDFSVTEATAQNHPVMAVLAHQAQAMSKKTSFENLRRSFGVKSFSSSMDEIAQAYITSIISYEDAYRTGHVLMPWGCDFGHEDAAEDYALMDQIIAYINAHYSTYGIEAFYSTAQRYVKDVQAMNYEWPVNEYDYFLDSDGAHSYWSGYLSSRAEYKGFERELMNERNAAEIVLSAVTTITSDFAPQNERMQTMREALGIAQHHDSITGTERTWVRDQYQNILTLARDNVTLVYENIYNKSTGVKTSSCRLANLSYCPETDVLSKNMSLSVYAFNPLAQARVEVITVPIPVEGVAAYLMPGRTALTSQVVTTWELTTTFDKTSPPIPAAQPYQIYIQVPFEAQSLTEILLVPDATRAAETEHDGDGESLVIDNEHYAVTLNLTSGMLQGVLNKDTQVYSDINQSISRYCPYPQVPQEQASGAYIFRTCSPNSTLIPYTSNFSTTLVTGALCTELRQRISIDNNMQQTVRLCKGQNWVEIISGIGEVRTYYEGVEVIMHIGTDVDSEGVWYTDSQGLEMQQRVRDSRPNYPYTVTEPIAANFFPCNTFSYINSTSTPNKNMAVIADRSRATASINDGELQFLVQRRLIYDDNRGVGEPLDEHTRVLTSSRVVFNSANLISDMRLGSQYATHKPILRFGAPSNATGPFKFLSRSAEAELPKNVHLHTRTLLAPGTVLIRLQHLFAAGEGPLATEVTVDLASVLPSGAFIVHVTDMDLNGVVEATKLSRLDFPTCVHGDLEHTPARPIGGSAPATGEFMRQVTLHPMEIRVLKIDFTVIPVV